MQGRNLRTQNTKGKSITRFKIIQESDGTCAKAFNIKAQHIYPLTYEYTEIEEAAESKGKALRIYQQWMESVLLSPTRKIKQVTETNCVARQRQVEEEGT